MDLKRHMAVHPIPWMTLSASLLLLAAAHAFENFGGLEPCPLCLRQREAHWTAVAVSSLILVITWRAAAPVWRDALMAGLVAVYVASTSIAFYHFGVEQKWWDAPASCAVNSADSLALSDMLERLRHRAAASSCDDIPWSFLGLSMAGYNALFSLMLASLSAWTLRPYLSELQSVKKVPST